ncbi:hypothetical protein ABK040_007906 [Willaertia magna]
MSTTTVENNKFVEEVGKSNSNIGIIIPPPSLKHTIEVTADHIVKNGLHFEKKKIEESIEDEIMRDRDSKEELDTKENTIVSKSASITFRKDRTKPTKDPFEYFYDIPIPTTMRALELDIIKLTAQFTAMNGRQFLSNLLQKESKNPQFDFLKTNHKHYHFFNRLTDIYIKILFPDQLTPLQKQKDLNLQQQGSLEEKVIKDENLIFNSLRLFADPNNKMKVLDLMFQKAEWEVIQEEKQRKEQSDQGDNKILFDAIDWQDFVVVETIDFDEDVSEIEEEVEMKENEEMEEEEIQHYEEEEEEYNPLPQRLSNEEDNESEEDNLEQFVRKDYKRENVIPKKPAPLMFKDRQTGELIPADKAEQHLKISTINPQYMEQKEREKSKFKITNLAPESEITKNIVSWSEDAKPAEQKTKVDEQQIWDGYTSSIQRTTTAAIKAPRIFERKESNIGPKIPTEQFQEEEEGIQQVAQLAAMHAIQQMMNNGDHPIPPSTEEPEVKKQKTDE